MKYKIAIASTDGKLVNQHFGKADTFYIIEADGGKGTYEYKESRKLIPVCDGGDHDEFRLKEAAGRLKDCKYILVSRIGYGAQNVLKQAGIEVFELPGIIEDSVQKLLIYRETQKLAHMDRKRG